MWADLAERYGLVVHRIVVDWSGNVDPATIGATLAEKRDIRAVLLTYCDTANGVRNDIAGVGTITRRRDVLLLVGGVSSVGGMPFASDEWGVDFAVTASQKCLMSSPGLAFVTLSERAWSATKTARLPRGYWDFAETQKLVTRPKPETPGTTPVHAMLQVAEAVRLIQEERIEQVYRRHEEMAASVRRRLPELDLRLQCPELKALASTVTAIAVPAGIEPSVIRQGLKQRGILTAAGLGPFEMTGFRIGHMGDIRPADVERTMTALGEVLAGARSLAAP
jgi:aspartate aminotransferase-like enzyme